MRVDRDVTTMAETKRACIGYDEYAQCHACGWAGVVADFAGHVQAKHPQPDVAKRIYRR